MLFSRRTLLKAAGLGTLAGITGGCDAVGSVFGRMLGALRDQEREVDCPPNLNLVVSL
jgi:hypothetical protein